MGQKIHPRGMRLGYIQDWQSRWFAPKKMPELIGEDFEIRKMIGERFQQASVSWVDIERAGPFLKLTIHTARPGVVIGRRGTDIENLKKDIETLTKRKVYVNVSEIKIAEMDSRLVGQSIAQQLEKRISHKRAIKRAMERTMASGALGIKVQVGGRLGGSEIARREWFRKGRVPLQTLSADIDYGLTEAYTTMGKIGIKVWIFKKLFFAKTPRELMEQLKKLEAENPTEVSVMDESAAAKRAQSADDNKQGA
ncbi:MAG TPA: 30S ribosomal protein S3 [Elusimicrobia bacterium]|nr:30S ribosomal protein S3 [Elusimicrobiota bacterium]HCE97296.1 30S ribosomal protein S3 [Elusimicrobiota bacterium]